MLDKKCEAGCMSFDGGEVKHRRDCVHYPESLTKIWHDTEAALLAENEKLRAALEPFAFTASDTVTEAWELMLEDRVRDWIDFEDIACAREILTRSAVQRPPE